MLTNPILAANTDSFFLAFSPEFLAYKKRVVKIFSLAPALWILLLFAPEFLAFSPEFLAFSPEFLAFSRNFSLLVRNFSLLVGISRFSFCTTC